MEPASAIPAFAEMEVAKKQLAENEEKFRNVLLQSPSIFLILKGPELVIDFVNEPLLRSWNKNWDIVGKTLDEALPEIKNQPFPKLLKQVYDTAETYSGKEEKAVILKDGVATEVYYNYTYRPVIDNAGTVSGITVMATDITEQVVARKRIEEAKKASEKQKRLYEAITASTPDLIYVFDLNYRFTYANKALLAMWGSTWDNSIGKNLLENGYEPWHAEMHEREIDQVVATKQSIRGEVSFPHAELGKRIYDYIFVPVLNEQGDVEAVAGTTRDITEIKRAEEAMKQSSEKLEALVTERTKALQRSNEDLQQFAHVASHDMKEPVRKITTFSNRLKDEFKDIFPEKAQTYLGKIEKAAKRIYSMIDGVLLYSSYNSVEQMSQDVDLGALIRDIETDLEILIQEKGAILKYENLPVVRGSSVLLYQLFYNLLNNSLKFSNTRPLIIINVINVVGSELAKEGLEGGKDYLKITVQDNGIGFNQKYSEKIFQTFSRLHPKDEYEGTGLGLALCKKIAGRHGGVIAADGKEGEGARFTVILPAV